MPFIFAQSSDIARVEYTWFPQRDSDNSFRRFKTFFNYPIKLKHEDYLIPGIEYQNVEFQFNDEVAFNTQNLDRFQYYKLNLAYLRKFKENWRYAVEAGVVATSNFQSTLTSDDVLFNGSVYVIKSRPKTKTKKKARLILGLTFNTNAGTPFPLPFVNYFKEVNSKFTYTLGVPKSNIKYLFTPKHIMQVFVTLDGFYANVQKDIAITRNNVTEQASELSMLVALSGLGYQYKFTDNFSFYAYSGYTLINDIRLRDEDADDIFTINDKNSIYFRFGLKFKVY
ncbi:DUF6268 family outer membrane beta-barrel protein [Mesohalobacter halotolerans]|nr:DUF6268 family outer membrane beta-barrel protein [Mesohalobacter halotolerans]